MLLKKYSILLFTLFLFNDIYSQQKSRSSLEKERHINLQKIDEAEIILRDTEKSKSNSIGKLNVINRQIINRENLILTLGKDIQIQNKELKYLEDLISSLINDLNIWYFRSFIYRSP